MWDYVTKLLRIACAKGGVLAKYREELKEGAPDQPFTADDAQKLMDAKGLGELFPGRSKGIAALWSRLITGRVAQSGPTTGKTRWFSESVLLELQRVWESLERYRLFSRSFTCFKPSNLVTTVGTLADAGVTEAIQLEFIRHLVTGTVQRDSW